MRIRRRAGFFATLLLSTGAVALAVGVTTVGITAAGAAAAAKPFLTQLNTVSSIGSTVPANGDVNPYGVALVSSSTGKLVAGDTLVSNFNDKANVQGTGTTIVEVTPSGRTQLFSRISHLPSGAACPGGVGLSTALAILRGGWVVVGSLPTGAGGALPKQAPAGCIIVLNSDGVVVETFSNPNINGPWDMVAQATVSGANLFVSNSLGGNTKTHKGVPVAGNCTIVRLSLTIAAGAPPQLVSSTVVGSAYPWKADKAALVLAPTGLALSLNGTLYVDNTLGNTVSAIPDAVDRTSPVSEASSLISMGGSLNAPLGMVLAPNGDLVVVNGNNGVATELTPAGKQVASKTLVKKGAGDLFGLAVTPDGQGIVFVNDGTNALDQARHGAG